MRRMISGACGVEYFCSADLTVLLIAMGKASGNQAIGQPNQDFLSVSTASKGWILRGMGWDGSDFGTVARSSPVISHTFNGEVHNFWKGTRSRKPSASPLSV
jgi:hypothetical protein